MSNATKTATLKVKTTETAKDCTGHSDLRSPLILTHGYSLYMIGGVPKGQEGRKEFGGEMVPGPFHFIFGLCTVIDNHGGTGAEMERAGAAGIVRPIAPGMKIEIDGLKYTVKDSGNGVLELR